MDVEWEPSCCELLSNFVVLRLITTYRQEYRGLTAL